MKNNSNKNLLFIKRILVVQYKGGKCQICDNNNILQLCLHHRNPSIKEFDFGNLKFKRWSDIKDELDKCDLLCRNCHAELHYNLNTNKDKRRLSKLVYVEYKGCVCEECGYDKSSAALTFHHMNEENKDFCIGSLSVRIKTLNDLTEKITDELNKCQLLCFNCHTLKHTDIEYFNTNKELLYEKAKNHKELQSKLNREEVMMMYNNGMKQVDIVKHFSCAKSTISEIITKYKKMEM